jgi:hypothetical protein
MIAINVTARAALEPLVKIDRDDAMGGADLTHAAAPQGGEDLVRAEGDAHHKRHRAVSILITS